MILADLSAVEHGIERCDFIDLHWCHVEDLSDFVHCRECQKVLILLLCDEEYWDACRLLVVGWVLLKDSIDLCVVFLSEFEGCILVVVLGVSVVRER